MPPLTPTSLLVHIAVSDVCCAMLFFLTVSMIFFHALTRPTGMFWLLTAHIQNLLPFPALAFMLGFSVSTCIVYSTMFGLAWGVALIVLMLAHLALAALAVWAWVRVSRRLWASWAQFRQPLGVWSA